jgi:hypothetical protein
MSLPYVLWTQCYLCLWIVHSWLPLRFSPVFIDVHVPSQKSGRSCICVLGVSILHLSTILILNFGTVLTVWYFFLFYGLSSVIYRGSSWSWWYGRCNYNYLWNQCLSLLKFMASVLDTIFGDKVCQWLAAGRWFSQGRLVSSTNKSYLHDITEILLKKALNCITYLL